MNAIKYLLLMFYLFFYSNSFAKQPALLLSNQYKENIEIKDYWVSEKLDGVRAYWDGKTLKSRQGTLFNAPAWFTHILPNIELDGELWIGRQRFSEVSGLVRRQGNSAHNWKNIKYMIFDLPLSQETFDIRLKEMKIITEKVNSLHFKAIKQYKVKTHKALKEDLDEIVALGGEGLMLHKGSSYYQHGRSNDLLKLKKYYDAEAVVIKRIRGKGKYKNMLGALLVENSDRVRFKIGTGFTDSQRQNPPKIGEIITYKYFGLTSKGKPRFTSFMRVRK